MTNISRSPPLEKEKYLVNSQHATVQHGVEATVSYWLNWQEVYASFTQEESIQTDTVQGMIGPKRRGLDKRYSEFLSALKCIETETL